jgi:hypothetical protein
VVEEHNQIFSSLAILRKKEKERFLLLFGGGEIVFMHFVKRN